MFSTTAPAAAFLEFLPAARDASSAHAQWTPADGPAPALYISHGAPPLFEDAAWIEALAAWAHRMPKPRGIVIVSAHWEQAPHARHCHPPRAEEHLLPLMTVAGAAGQDAGRKVFSDRVMETTLSAFVFG